MMKFFHSRFWCSLFGFNPCFNFPLLIVCVLMVCSEIIGQEQWEGVRFDHLNVEQGLSQNSVRCILQDRQGFMWFGTYDGLNRYDGYEFKIYRNRPGDSLSIPHNSITSLFEDSSGILWVGTVKGLSCFDPVTEKFYRVDPNEVTSLCQDEDGNIWASRTGLSVFLAERQYVSQNFHLPWNSSGTNMEYFTSLLFQKPDILWLGNSNGTLFQFNTKQKQFLLFRKNLKIFSPGQDKRISSILEDRDGIIWLGTRGSGLVRYDPVADEFTYFTPDPQNSHSLSSSLINCIYEDHQGNLWIGSQNGLLVFDKKKKSFFRFKHRPGVPGSLSDDKILSIYQDKFGTYWIGTKGGGINKFNLKTVFFDYYLSAEEVRYNPSASKVWTFYEDRQRNLWVGTSGGLIRMVKKNKRLDHADFKLFPIRIDGPVNRSVRSICEDDSGNLWLALIRGGLAKFVKKSGKITYFVPDEGKLPCLTPNIFYVLFPIDQSNLWIGTNGCGLLNFNIKTGEFQNKWYRNSADKKRNGWIICIYRDKEGDFWLGTWKNGLIRFRQTKKDMIVYRHDVKDPFSLNNNTVFSILEDHRGNLWIGTYGGGLNKLDRRTGKFIFYTRKDGLPNDVIYGILEDDHGNLWMSTNKGLSCFNPETGQFLNFDVNDGLQGNEFNLGAYFKSADGTLFFGGNNGFNCFKPANMINEQPPEVVLTGFKKFGKSIKFDQSISSLKKIVVSYKDNFFTFQFAALHFKNPSKNKYAYKLEGFDKDWIFIGKKREASYTNLDPGKYFFRVKAANCDGIWNEKGLTIPLIIRPPFWQTYWFYLSVLIFILGGLLIVHKAHLRSQINQALLIERVRMNERQEIQKKISRDFHDELGHRLTKITLFGNLLSRELKDASNQSLFYLHKILYHSHSLFEETRDFIWQLDPQKDSLYEWVVHLKNFSDELFEQTEISFRIEGAMEEWDKIHLPLEWRMHLLRIFKEALHNILKHAQKCKNIILKVQCRNNLLEVILVDDGVGFEVNRVSNGEGLNNMIKRAQTIGGKLVISSEPNEGTKIRFFGKLPERRVDL